jgi:peptidyl-prolyl cis-trans isomerase A (cyclophilin A)
MAGWLRSRRSPNAGTTPRFTMTSATWLSRRWSRIRRSCIAVGVLLALGIVGVRSFGGRDGDRQKKSPLREDRSKRVSVLIQTEKGDIEVELDAAKAPATVANFLRYLDDKFYDGGRFHRTVKPDNQPRDQVKIGVIQAGIDPKKAKDEFPPIKLERTRDTGLRHKDGTISMARDGPDTATSDFFLCVGDQPELDFGGKRNPDGQGFAAFGRVVRGMDVVKKIQAAPAKGQSLTPPIKIVKVKRTP